MYDCVVADPWPKFSECDTGCGGGIRNRTNVDTNEVQQIPCNTQPCGTGAYGIGQRCAA